MTTELVVPAANPGRVPKVSELLYGDSMAIEYWKRYWKHGCATLWTSSEEPQVARLCLLMSAMHRVTADSESTTRMNVQISKLEQALFLTPQSRKTHHIIIEVEAPEKLSSRRGELAERIKKSA